MRFLLTVFVTLFLLAGPAIAAAQTGTLSGRVIEPDTRAPVSGATVTVQGADVEAITDAGGNYELELGPGTYTLEIEAGADFEARTIEDVEVAADRPTEREVTLARGGGERAAEFGDFTVQSGYIEGSPASVVTTQREAPQVSDVIGSDQFEAAGDGDAAEALKRVSGLAVEGGKFVTIRGQPTRYTKTTFNGSPLPSPDPIRRIVPLDLFPTGVLSEISVSKSYDASQPGSFGSGLIDLRTTGVPQETFFEISAEVGANSESTGEDGRDHEGGDTDFLGIDDDTREISGGLDSELNIGRRSNQQQLEQGARSMPNIYSADEETLPPDAGLGVAAGTTGEFAGADAGVRGAVSWSQEWRNQDRIDREFGLQADGGLNVRNDQLKRQTDRDVDVSGFATAALDWGEHKLTSNSFILRQTRQRTQVTTGSRDVSDTLEIRDTLLDFNERELMGQQFVGEHDFPLVDVTWRAMMSEAERDNPDRRRTRRIRELGSDSPFRLSDREDASRRFLQTEDEVGSFSIDLERNLLDGDRWNLDVSGGLSTYDQTRSTVIQRLGLRPDPGQVDLEQPVEQILAPENLGNGVVVKDETDEIDLYAGQVSINAGYLRGDVNWRDTLRVVAGLRQEEADFTVVTFNQSREAEVGGFDETDTLPSLATTWFFAEDMQLRFAAGRTVSRPVLNEISNVRYTDPDTDFDFIGNPELRPAEIDSLDLRWEWFPSSSELISVGAFYKEYTDPLEVIFVPQSGAEKQRRVENSDEATVEGIEATARFNLPRLTGAIGSDPDWADQVYVQGNVALIDSEVTTDDAFVTNQVRELQGQADELINLRVGYDRGRHDFNVALNFTGDRLSTVGVQGQPDIIEQSRTVVDLGYDYQWSDSLDLTFNVDNLLDEEVERKQGEEVAEGFNPGVDVGFGLKYRF